MLYLFHVWVNEKVIYFLYKSKMSCYILIVKWGPGGVVAGFVSAGKLYVILVKPYDLL